MLPALLLILTAANETVWQPGPEVQDRFRAHFEAGEKLYQEGDYGAAIWNFRHAGTLRFTPEVAYDLAKCHEKLGDLPFATFYYRLYLRRAPQAPDALNVAEKVGTVLAAAEGEGRGVLELEAAGATDLTLAGRSWPEGPVALFLPPGEYPVEAKFPSGTRRMVAQVRTGKTTLVSFEPLPPPLLDSAQALPEGALSSGPAVKVKPLRAASYATFGAGAAAVVAGTVLGIVSRTNGERVLSDKSLTVSEANALAQGANGMGVSANILWSVGGAAMAGGALMFVFSMPEPGMKSGGASP